MKKSNIKILLTGLVVVLTLTSKAQWEGPKYGEDSIACITNISLYREAFRLQNYAEVTDIGRNKENCPMSTKNIFTNVLLF